MKRKVYSKALVIASLFGLTAAGVSAVLSHTEKNVSETKATDFTYEDHDVTAFKDVVYQAWATFVLDGVTDYGTAQDTKYHLDVMSLNMWTNIYCNDDTSIKLYTSSSANWTGITVNIAGNTNGVSGQVNADILTSYVLASTITKVTVPSGTEFPSYGLVKGTSNVVYRTTKDVSFVRSASKWIIEPNPADNEVATYFTIVDVWNPGDYGTYSGLYTYAVRFTGSTSGTSFSFGSTADATDVSAAIGNNITLNGASFNSVGCKVHFAFGGFYLGLTIDPAALTEQYNVVEIKQNTVFQYHYLNACKFMVLKDGSMRSYIEATNINWNNLDYGNFAVTEKVDTLSLCIPQNGYCFLLKYSKNITGQSSASNNSYINLKNSSVTNLLDYVYVNGELLSNNSKAIIGTYANMLYIYVPNDFGFRPYVEIRQGAYIGTEVGVGNIYLAPTNLIANGGIGSSNVWSFANSAKVINNVTYTGITGNGTSYNNYKDGDGNDKKGLLLNFSGNLSSHSSLVSGVYKECNFASTSTFGSLVKLNGNAFNTIANAELKYFSNNMMWIYVPDMGTNGNILEIGSFALDDALTPAMNFRYVGSAWYAATKIIFDSNGGSDINPYFGISNSESYDTIAPAFIPTRTGYRFNCWKLNGATIPAGTNCTGLSQTLVADWVKTYEVTFSGATISAQTVDENGYATKPTNNPTKANAHFDGYYEDAECQNEFDFENTQITADKVIYVKFIDCSDGVITYSEPTADHKMTATLYCSVDQNEVLATETVSGVYTTDTPATCLAEETGHYDYDFENPKFVDKVENVTLENTKGHIYGDVTVLWNGDEATATMVCERTGCLEECEGHTVAETKAGDYVMDTPATCNSYETGHYEVTFDDTRLGSAQTTANSVLNTDSPKPAHDYSEPSYEWTMEEQVSCVASKSCENEDCEEIVIENAEVSYEVITAPTCTEDGLGRYTATFATIDSTTKDVTLSAKGHSEELIEGKDATCSLDGYKECYYCDDCGNYFEDEECTQLIGNEAAYEAWILDAGKLAKENVEHTPGEVVVENIDAPTCTENGSHDEVVYCTVCGEELSRITVGDAALGHSWDEGQITKPATCTEDGVKTFTCECGETKTEVIPATGHKLGALIPEVAATTEKEGMKAHYVCSVCGQFFDENKKPCTQESLVIAKLEPVTPDQPEEGTGNSIKDIFGCKGSLIASSAIIAGLALAGAALVAAKKKED